MKHHSQHLINTIRYAFVLLFTYAAVSKILDFENVQVQLGQSPLLNDYTKPLAYMVVWAELAVAGLLCYPKTQQLGLALCFWMMFLFCGYVLWLLVRNSALPCSCGGLLQLMSWPQHLAFNLVFMLLAAMAWQMNRKKKK